MKTASWGLLPPSEPAAIRPVHWRDEAEEIVRAPGSARLAYGRGRSYGDVCLNNGGALIPTAALDRILLYDRSAGLLTAEAGVTFAQVLRLIVPDGWFTPVTPGTSHLSLGGAIANDVHGKEHVSQGTIGRHVQDFVLWRSAEGPLNCSPQENPDMFRATIGGLGLTGLITQATIRLRRIPGPCVEIRTAKAGFDDLWNASGRYSVAWIDSSAPDRAVITAGDFVPGPLAPPRRTLPAPPLFPSGLLNRTTLGLLNRLRWSTQRPGRTVQSYEQFFHPLDRLAGWNHLYGPGGFYQHQSVIPRAAGAEPVRELLRELNRRGGASFVSVLKALGPLPSPGLLSFPREGLTLALDLPNRGQPTLELLDALDRIVVGAGGRLYPAKDARMSPATFRAGYPQWETFSRWVDPAFSSTFWRRVTASL